MTVILAILTLILAEVALDVLIMFWRWNRNVRNLVRR